MKVYVPHTLRVRVPNASYVAVVGDFNNWHSNAHPLVQLTHDTWGRIVDLPLGTHDYAFFVIEDSADGSIRSHLVGQGKLVCRQEDLSKTFQVSSYPALAVNRPERREEVMVA